MGCPDPDTECAAYQDRTDDKLATMNLKELFQLMKDCQQMDTKFSISKLASAFIAANACAEAGDDGTWNDWDWELSFEEFIEVASRHACQCSASMCAARCSGTNVGCAAVPGAGADRGHEDQDARRDPVGETGALHPAQHCEILSVRQPIINADFEMV